MHGPVGGRDNVASKLSILPDNAGLVPACRIQLIPKGTLANWVSAAKRTTDRAAPPGSRRVAELEVELAKLRKELAVEPMEKEVLEKTAAYFAKEPLRYVRAVSVSLDMLTPANALQEQSSKNLRSTFNGGRHGCRRIFADRQYQRRIDRRAPPRLA
jgi:transposase